MTDPKAEACAHMDFNAEVDVNRMEDTGKFFASIRVVCRRCGEAFRFLRAPPGIMLQVPHVNIDGTELTVEIEPEGQKRLATNIPIHMPKIPERT